MNLSKKDRVLFINQYEILKRLDPDSAAQYEELIEILTAGYKIFYSKLDEWVFDEMEVSEGRFVLETLDMYRALANYFRTNPDDRSAKNLWATFPGFDGNEETKYMSFTCFLIEKQHKFQEQLESGNVGFNSHSPCLPKYRSMLAVWETTGRTFDLDATQVARILDA
jgi:uncharacterized protein YfbU (UPF0304 family)